MDLKLKEILDLIRKERESAVSELLKAPRVAPGIGDFRYQIGFAAGLDQAADIINSILNEGDADERE